MRIRLKTITGQDLTLDVQPSNTVETVIKAKMLSTRRILTNQQVVIILDGIELESGKPLAEYRIRKGFVFHAGLRMICDSAQPVFF